MTTLEQLLQLVRTMTKAEKRYFRLYCGLQKGKKEYLYLYDKLDSCDSVEEVSRLFGRRYGRKNLDASIRYLYGRIMDCLVFLNDNNVRNEIFRLIMQASVLYERRFIREAFRALSKAKQLAGNFEQDILLMLIRRIEITYLTETGFDQLTEKELIGKHTKLNECMKFTRSTNLHISLYSTLKYRLCCRDIYPNMPKDSMNDLILSELNLVSNNYYHGFESMKLHLLFQASYYLNTGSYKSAIRYYSELLDLFDEYDYLKQNPPVYYFSTLEGIINSLLNAGIYDEIPVFVDKLKTLYKLEYPKDFLIKITQAIFFAQTQYLIHTGRYREAKQVCIENEERLYKNVKFLHPENRLNLYVYSAVIYLCNNEMKKAETYLKKIGREGKLFLIFPIYRTARLLKLIIDAEMGNYELLENEIRSLKRTQKKKVNACQTEKMIFRLVMMYPLPKYDVARARLWKKMEKVIRQIRTDKCERHLLNVFDFTAWIESRLTGASFESLTTNIV
ncbi:MAG: hypothetical protein LBH77_08715 [Tannerella sp.]|jgi:hypothetical protein|nr:hypothetical protein [Tannerella sp.]